MHYQKTLVVTVPLKGLKREIPMFGYVSAGFPSPAEDYMEEKLDLNQYLIPNPSSTFFIRADGFSMLNAGIFPDSILIVDRSMQAKHKDVIIAIVDGEFTLKRFLLKENKIILQPANPDFEALEILAHMQFQVWGVVRNVIHNPNTDVCAD